MFGSVTFAQVSKNDTINKPSSRKVSPEDLKNLPPETETAKMGYLKIKGEKTIKGENQKSDYLKVSPESVSSGKAILTQKGRGESAITTEKQHYTIKMTNADKKVAEDATSQEVSDDNAATTQKKHVANIKWTPGKVAKDTTSNESKALNPYIKIKGQK